MQITGRDPEQNHSSINQKHNLEVPINIFQNTISIRTTSELVQIYIYIYIPSGVGLLEGLSNLTGQKFIYHLSITDIK